MDRKIDLLYKAGLLGGQRVGAEGADYEEEDDVDASLVRVQDSATCGSLPDNLI